MARVYVGNLDPRVSERDLEDEFRMFGVLRSVWVARRPPGYAFIEFDDRRDAIDAIQALDENVVCALAHEVWVVEGAGALLLGAAGAQAMIDMDAGVLVRVGDLPGAAAYHLLHVVEATAGLLHSAMLAVCHHMPMVKVGSVGLPLNPIKKKNEKEGNKELGTWVHSGY
uniref:RRM domain-containing protein n=1 Tax=Cannabis sativa TaxID=3483 RepID=A0A803PEH5_CANSA